MAEVRKDVITAVTLRLVMRAKLRPMDHFRFSCVCAAAHL